MHRCPWPGCGQIVPRNTWGCRRHWYVLPNDLRAWIGRAYRQGIARGEHPSRSYRDAHRAALEWIREQTSGARSATYQTLPADTKSSPPRLQSSPINAASSPPRKKI
ncbi:hypothetical protein OKW39_003948 [Paraburkholderia sp. MM6662-R1]